MKTNEVLKAVHVDPLVGIQVGGAVDPWGLSGVISLTGPANVEAFPGGISMAATGGIRLGAPARISWPAP
jgi:hypothetical protein